MTRREQRKAAWAHADYRRRQESGQCAKCPNRALPGMSLCARCRKRNLAAIRKRLGYKPRLVSRLPVERVQHPALALVPATESDLARRANLTARRLVGLDAAELRGLMRKVCGG